MGSSGSRHPINDRLDDKELDEISRKTNLSHSEILKWHKEFLRDCPNGKLDQKLFIKIYKQSFPMGNATKFCKICFQAFDKDKSGYIDFFEFINAIGIFSRGNIEDKLKLAFDIYDSNNDGFVERKEAEKIVLSIFQLYGEDVSLLTAREQVDKLMNKLDKDKNGLISEEEFVNGK